MAQPCDDLDRNRPEFQTLCQSMIRHVPEVLALLDGQGKLLYVNPHTEKTLRYTLDEVEGRNIFEFIHPADRYVPTRSTR